MDTNYVHNIFTLVHDEINKYIIGQQSLIRKIIIAICVQGHVLVEGLPGLAKTSIIKLISKITGSEFSRVQFTPDLLPADITGTLIYNQKEEKFKAHYGPIFANLVLADEINRAPAKVQSALLQAMEEKTVTLGKEVYALPTPFFVMATQNPIENEGTYELPEAQLDRFLCKLLIDYPSQEEEITILEKLESIQIDTVKKICSLDDFILIGSLSEKVRVEESMFRYIVNIVDATRNRYSGYQLNNQNIKYGASPRASISLLRCARVVALFNKRDYVIPEDIKEVAYDILRHRIILNFDAIANEQSSDSVLENILNNVSIPK